MFACDVTYLNDNVAFELGYAIGRFKRIWISLDTSIHNAAIDYNHRYTGMLGAGYAGYENHQGLARAFLDNQPWATPEQFLLAETYRAQTPLSEFPTLLYVKPSHDTDSVISVREAISLSVFSHSLILDDPRENPGATLEWYADKISHADAVLIHLLSDDQAESSNHNAKASFVAGLAHGMQKPALMLAHAPFTCPTDYQVLLKSHQTAQQAVSHFQAWLGTMALPRRRPRRSADASAPGSPTLQLRDLSLGEPVAENERSSLDDYFVETRAFYDALESDVSVFVGRRGTGKTAAFIALEEALGRSTQNHVCTIKPVGYEVDGLIRLLSEEWRTAERGFLIESLWKFVLYSELAASVLSSIRSRPVHLPQTDDEERFVQYVEGNRDIFLSPFSQRVNRAVGALSGTADLSDVEQQRARISEHLHINHLGQLRRMLGAVLAEKKRVAVLIDNLDDQWSAGKGTTVLSKLLLGLLRMTNSIVDDVQVERQQLKRVNLSLTIFIRSDIFSYIAPLDIEQDKWPIRRVVWNDRDLLLRVIDERLARGGRSGFEADEVWANMFPQSVVGLSAKEFIFKNTRARPRDVIFLTKEAIATAVNRSHEAVTEEDMLEARTKYSRYVFGSVLAEDDPQRKRMEDVLFEFAGAPRVLSETDVRSRIERTQVPEEDVEFYLNLLCDVNFLGIQTATGYTFADDENARRMLREVSKHLAEERGWGDVSFEVNAAFYQALQIE